MSINNLVIALMAAYFTCAYFIVFQYSVLIFKGSKNEYYSFKIMWYHKVASTYVLALPLYFSIVYVVSKIL